MNQLLLTSASHSPVEWATLALIVASICGKIDKTVSAKIASAKFNEETAPLEWWLLNILNSLVGCWTAVVFGSYIGSFLIS